MALQVGPIAFAAATIIPEHVNDAGKPPFRAKYNTADRLGTPELVLYAQVGLQVFASVHLRRCRLTRASRGMVHRQECAGARSLAAAGSPIRCARCRSDEGHPARPGGEAGACSALNFLTY